ncbi:hypothetical protein FRC02_008103 [Tulasnella sp. 418]|nr:hypothetical protein FRC02_008103 [Tulasnella sp. 418]
MTTSFTSFPAPKLVDQRYIPRVITCLVTHFFGTRSLTRESLRDDLTLIAILFPMSFAPFPLAVASGTRLINSLVKIAKWATFLAFWCCLASSCATHWMLSRVPEAVPSTPSPFTLGEQWGYRIAFGVSRLVIVSCMVAGTIAVLGTAVMPTVPDQTSPANVNQT